ncbi:MAG: laminin G domain-containing protein, partial [Ruminococcus sp.]|nr:laminin G domain-containing protein [Ruminococcus sp.]
MQNMIKNAYTAYRIDNSTDYGNYISVSGTKFNGNILSFDMWLYIEDNGSEIVSQKDGFSIGISQDKVILRLPGKNTISLRSSAVGIPEKQWVNLYFGYDGKTVSIFINGNMIGEADMSGKITNANDILIGAEFTGYIRSLRIYSSVLDETVFRKYFMASEYRSADMKELSAFLDLTQESITDLCKTDIKAKINGGCACMDLVDVYCPAEGSYLYIQNSEDVAPGGFDSGQFSVYTKVYIRPSANGRQLLWINGEWNDQDKIALAADKQNGKTKFTAIFGSDEYTFSCEIQDYVWTDILLSSTGSKVIAYINGEKQEITAAFKRNKEGDLKIGGSQKAADMISSHYFHTVVVFDRALTADDAQAFMTDHPYIFEDGLIALISFEGGSAYEIAKGLTVTANKNGLLAAQRTVDVPPTDKYQFRLNYTKDAPSEMKKWEAEQVVAACRDFVEKMVGCSVTVQPAVHDMLIKYISNNSELLQESSKLYTKPTIQSDDVVSAIGNTDSGLIKAIFTVLMLSSAATAAYETAAMIGSSAATMSANKYAAIIAIGCVAAVSAAAVIVAEVNEKHK